MPRQYVILLALYLPWALPVPSFCQSLKPQSDAAFVQGVEQLKQQDWQGAVASFRLSLTTHPHRLETLFYLSQAYYLSGQIADAVTTIAEAMRLAPESGAAKQKYGEYLCEERECKKGLDLLLEARHLDPRLEHIDLDVAMTYYRLSNLAKATRNFELALEHEPRNGDAMIFLAECYSREPDWPRAERMYRRALAAGKRDAGTYRGLGAALLGLNQPAAALAAFEQALAMDPSLAECHFQMASALRSLGRPQEAARHLKIFKAIQQTIAVPAALSRVSDPDQETLWAACQRLLEQGNEAEALERLRSVTGARADYLLGALYYSMKRFENAERVLKTAVQSDGRDLDALGWLGRAQLANGELAAAESRFERVLEIDPANQLGLAGEGVIRHAQQRWAESADWIERSRTREPAALLDLCDDYLKLGRREDAELAAELVRSFGAGDEAVQSALEKLLPPK